MPEITQAALERYERIEARLRNRGCEFNGSGPCMLCSGDKAALAPVEPPRLTEAEMIHITLSSHRTCCGPSCETFNNLLKRLRYLEAREEARR